MVNDKETYLTSQILLIDMEISNNWTIVIGVATIISLILHWSKQAYLDPIVSQEDSIKEKVRNDIFEKVETSEEIIKERGEEQFAEEIYDIILFRKNLRELKEIFRGKMVVTGILICVVAIILVSISAYYTNNIIFMVVVLLVYILILAVLSLIGLFLKMKKYERRLSRYLEGENPSDILN